MWKSYLLQQLKPSLVQEQSMQSLTHADSKSCSSPSLSTHPTCKEMKTAQPKGVVDLLTQRHSFV